MQQTTLTDDTTTTDEPTTSTTDRESSSNAKTTLAPPDQRGGKGCCPWCLAAPETFNHRDDGSVGCGHCDASIPAGTEWYERREKIVI